MASRSGVAADAKLCCTLRAASVELADWPSGTLATGVGGWSQSQAPRPAATSTDTAATMVSKRFISKVL